MEYQSLFPPTVMDWIHDYLITLLFTGLLLMLPVTCAHGELYVSPDGNDDNPGTQSKPLRTLQGARDRIRNLDKNGTQDILVLFKVGDYFIENTVRFGREDSGSSGSRVIYKNWDKKGSARFIGGQPNQETSKHVDNNVYYNPEGHYSFGRMSFDDWRRMGLDTHTNFADPLFVDRENHDYRLRPDSPALILGFENIDTGGIGLKKDFPYKDGG